MKLEPWMWAVFSHAFFVWLTVPDPPPDLLIDSSFVQRLDHSVSAEGGDISVNDLSLLAAMDLLASALTDDQSADAIRASIRESFAKY